MDSVGIWRILDWFASEKMHKFIIDLEGHLLGTICSSLYKCETNFSETFVEGITGNAFHVVSTVQYSPLKIKTKNKEQRFALIVSAFVIYTAPLLNSNFNM